MVWLKFILIMMRYHSDANELNEEEGCDDAGRTVVKVLHDHSYFLGKS